MFSRSSNILDKAAIVLNVEGESQADKAAEVIFDVLRL